MLKTFISSRYVKLAQLKSIMTDIEQNKAVEKVILLIKASPEKL